MQQVFHQCTVCYEALTKEELKRHEEDENYYFTICTSCVEKAKKRVFKIVEVEEE